MIILNKKKYLSDYYIVLYGRNELDIDNLALKRRLSKISTIESRVGISYCVTPTNDYVLLKNDLPADDLHNPREAVKKMLKDSIKTDKNIKGAIVKYEDKKLFSPQNIESVKYFNNYNIFLKLINYMINDL